MEERMRGKREEIKRQKWISEPYKEDVTPRSGKRVVG